MQTQLSGSSEDGTSTYNKKPVGDKRPADMSNKNSAFGEVNFRRGGRWSAYLGPFRNEKGKDFWK